VVDFLVAWVLMAGAKAAVFEMLLLEDTTDLLVPDGTAILADTVDTVEAILLWWWS
jgi:gamma-glutamyl phosphate reductase